MLFTAFRKYAVFSGRARRKEYWQFILLVVVLTAVAGLIDRAIGMPEIGLGEELGGPVENFVSIATLLPSLAVGWRRMHDIGRTGWLSILWLLPPLLAAIAVGIMVPIPRIAIEMMFNSTFWFTFWFTLLAAMVTLLAFGYVFYLLVRSGTPGPNRYGPDPKATGLEELGRVFA